MRFPLFSSKRLGIDLGTASCLVWSQGEGVVLSEPSVVAVDSISGRVAAVGSQAAEMLGRTAGNLVAQRPLRDGVVADFLVAESMLAYFLDKVLGSSRLARPEVMVCIPWGITQVERRAVLEAALSAGAKTAYLIEHPLSAAIGAKLPIEASVGNMIVDIGAGQVGAAVISLGGIVTAASTKSGGDRLDEAIVTYVRRSHNLLISERMAEEIKIKIGSAVTAGPRKSIDVKGRDAIVGMPKAVTINSEEVAQAMAPVLVQIINCIKSVLEKTPPELSSDIIDRGIVLTGGSSQRRNLDRLISTATGLSCHVAEDPVNCVVYGTGTALENIEHWKRVISVR